MVDLLSPNDPPQNPMSWKHKTVVDQFWESNIVGKSPICFDDFHMASSAMASSGIFMEKSHV